MQPGGLDIPSLLSTGTSLLAGLLGNDENFGKVLGSYIGLAVEGMYAVNYVFRRHQLTFIQLRLGLSGGGGAVNEKQTF